MYAFEFQSKSIVTNMLRLVIILMVIAESIQQQGRDSSENPCITKKKCNLCIQTPGCAWCSAPNLDIERCFMKKFGGNATCPLQYTSDPQNEYIPVKQTSASLVDERKGGLRIDSSYSESSSSSSHHHHPFSTQHVKLKLRVNTAHRMDLFYQQAVDYPVDLYYLMDLSNSMKDDKEKLSQLGDTLASTMKNITSDFRLGFGSFVDKVVMPFVSTVPKFLKQPCTSCAAPYGFHNVMPLRPNLYDFAVEVKKAEVSGNLDAPEGGFDAIMQAIVCDEIGWRKNSRKLLVFSTDAAFHYAGDGKLGGIVTPNDGCCHLDKHGMYTYSTVQDYPSISQINLKVKQHAVNIIFAVTSDQITLYDSLRQHIEGSSCGTLSNDSSNVVDLVKEQYDRITSSVEIRDTANTKYFSLKYYTKCLDSKEWINSNKCDGLRVGKTVQFQVEIEVKECPANPKDWNQVFRIYPVGLSGLTVDVDLLCGCPCEREGFIENAAECYGFGTLKCGICDCIPSHFGPTCKCNIEEENLISVQSGSSSVCRKQNDKYDCSGRGTCECNHCICERGFTGDFCECNNLSCDYHNQTMCSGLEHGTCRCGKCDCKTDWTGNACQCSTKTSTCQPPGGGEICSGKGDCVCGACKCTEQNEGRYSGRYCEKCPTCPGRCPEFKHCVQCRVYKTGPLSQEECEKNCNVFALKVVQVVEVTEDKNDESFCFFTDEEECRYTFSYQTDEFGKITLTAPEKMECPPKAQIMAVAYSVIGMIVLIGMMVLVVWKVATTIKDRREVAKFERERMNAKWDTGENPIYKQATSTFKNPTYIGK